LLIPCAVTRRPVSRSQNSQSCSTKSFNDTRSSALMTPALRRRLFH
jgi:hypothetical protein